MDKQLQKYLPYVTLVAGLYYAFASHELHMRYSPDWTLLGLNLSHRTHQLIGYVLIAYSLYVLNAKYKFIKL